MMGRNPIGLTAARLFHSLLSVKVKGKRVLNPGPRNMMSCGQARRHTFLTQHLTQRNWRGKNLFLAKDRVSEFIPIAYDFIQSFIKCGNPTSNRVSTTFVQKSQAVLSDPNKENSCTFNRCLEAIIHSFPHQCNTMMRRVTPCATPGSLLQALRAGVGNQQGQLMLKINCVNSFERNGQVCNRGRKERKTVGSNLLLLLRN